MIKLPFLVLDPNDEIKLFVDAQSGEKTVLRFASYQLAVQFIAKHPSLKGYSVVNMQRCL